MDMSKYDRFAAAQPYARRIPLEHNALDAHDAIEYQRTVLASRGYLLLLRRLLLRSRAYISARSIQARIDGLPLDVIGEAIICDIDAALASEKDHVTNSD